MLRKVLVVLLSVFVVSNVCFAQGESTQVEVEDTASAVESVEDTAKAEEESSLALENITMCTAVEDREPVGAGTVFSDTLEKIFCFTKVVGAKDTTSVTHVWYMGNRMLASVKLTVNSASWRTWSSKMLDMGLGKGHVEIISEEGNVLGKAEFEIKEVEETEEE